MSRRDLGALDAYTAEAVFASGLNGKVRSIRKYGFNPDVDVANEEDIWDEGGLYDYAITASTLSVVSTGAGDSAAGAGISQVFIVGLDAEYNEAEEIIQLDGTTPVLGTIDFIRVYRMRAYSTGALGGENSDASGDITATTVIDTKVQAVIQEGNTSTKMTMYTVPTGFTGFVTEALVSGGQGDDFIADLQIRSPGGVFVTVSETSVTNSAISNVSFTPYFGPIPEKTDIKVKAIATSNNAQVRTSYSVLLLRNDYLDSLAKSI